MWTPVTERGKTAYLLDVLICHSFFRGAELWDGSSHLALPFQFIKSLARPHQLPSQSLLPSLSCPPTSTTQSPSLATHDRMVPLTRQKSRGRSSSVPNTPSPPPPPHNAGLRTKWRKLSLSARNVFCLRSQNRVYDDCDNEGSQEVLHIRSRSHLSWTSSSRDHLLAPSSGTPSPNSAQHTHTAENASGDEAKEATNKLTTKSTEQTTRSEAAVSLNSPLINAKGAYGPGDASPLCDHASFLYFDNSADHHPVATTGDTIGALIDALFQFADWDSMLTPGPPTPFTATDDADSEKTIRQEEEGRARKDADVPTDARQAWEAMKRRVLHIEEHGALPDDWEDDDEAAAWGVYRDAEAELASREQRARRRKGWAQEALMHCHSHSVGQQPRRRRPSSKKKVTTTPSTPTTTKTGTTAKKAKKGRRHGGCWVREKDGVFVRLVRFQLCPLGLLFFFLRACRKTLHSF